MNNRLLLVVLLFACGVFTSHAQSRDTLHLPELEKRYNIFFRINSPVIDYKFKDNAKTIETMRKDIQTTFEQNGSFPDTISVVSTASPDGGHDFNERLARRRAASMKALLLEMLPPEVAEGIHINIRSLEEDWGSLMQILMAHPEFPQREQMLSILTSKAFADEEQALRKCKEGWKHLVRNYIYVLRNASVSFTVIGSVDEYTIPKPLETMQAMRYSPTLKAPESGVNLKREFVRPVLEEKKMIMAARTNLLVPGLNVGLEFPIKDNWSVGVDYWYPWAVSKNNKWCGEMLGLFVDGKYWFTGEKYKWTKAERLQGHAVGVYAGLGYYDYQKIDRGAQGEYVDVGVDYTFGLPIAKGKLRMEFNLGIGWILTYYRSYYPSSDFDDLIKDPGIIQRSTSFFGPTRASVSFVVPIRVNRKVRF